MRQLFGLVFALAGGVLVLVGLRVISIGTLVAPPALVITLGAGFILAGLSVAVPSTRIEDFPLSGTHTIQPVENLAIIIGGWLLTAGLAAILAPLAFESGASSFSEALTLDIVIHPWIEFLFALFLGMGLLTARYVRYGRIPLRLVAQSARAGEVLKASMSIRRKHGIRTVAATLTCRELVLRRERSGGKMRRHISKTVMWSMTACEVDVRPDERVDIRIPIPVELPGATPSGRHGGAMLELGTPGYAWELQVRADVWGVDLESHYEIPVRDASPESKAAASAREAQNEVALQAEEAAAERAATRAFAEKVQAVRTSALAELAAGQTLDALADRLSRGGTDDEVLVAGVKGLASETGSPHAAAARTWLAHREKLQSEMQAGQVMMLSRPAKSAREAPRPEAQEHSRSSVFTAFILLVAGTAFTYYVVPLLPSLNPNQDLVEAIIAIDPERVDKLLRQGADPNFRTGAGESMLELAAQKTEERMVISLLRAGADPNAGTLSGSVLLHMFAQGGHAEIVRLMLEKGADPDATHSTVGDGLTALMLASKLGNPETIRALLEHGADPRLRSRRGENAFDWARAGRRPENLRALQELGGSPNGR